MSTPLWVAALLNVVRCVSIGCLLMPFVTWGTSSVERGKTAHATALLTSLRTISGAIGSATFVSIMTVVAGASMEKYGNTAPMHGLNVTFAAMASVSLILLLVAVFATKKRLMV
jgi:hypothetical protein